MSNELTGRNALVLGVERPAGRKAAIALAEAGADVAVVTLTEETPAEFAANSTANEFWALGRKGMALTTDGREGTVAEAIADATAELGPISILVWHATHSIAKITGLRSDPAVIVLLADDEAVAGNRALLDWTRDLADAGLRANALIATPALAEAIGPVLKLHHPPQPLDLLQLVVYLASDASAAIEGAAVVATAP
ncbi:MAG: SDR family NAD(P)-dependent oxidoreductase [Chloroflexi bacterium]|nr:SDR family NAD(P)-dependent oxidoreductase [Chloroflexota bacterium]